MHVEERVPTLEGRAVTLRPLTMGDAPVLLAVTPRETFRHFLAWPTSWDLPAFRVWMERYLFKPDQMPFAVVLQDDGAIVGSTSFMDVQPQHRHVEIGCTWYTPAVRGTVVNPESKLLLLRHAFDAMGCVRVTLKCDGRNEVSQRAIAKLGAVREGTLRHHRIQPDGFIRDTVYFSIVAAEWPAVREKLEARLRARGV
jgi:RimJ/RimL family protein N-acetyltransferase